MTQNASFIRKIIYGCAIVVLLFPAVSAGAAGHQFVGKRDGRWWRGIERRRAGTDAQQLRVIAGGVGTDRPCQRDNEDGDARAAGVATNLLWTKANAYKKTESWDKLSATLNQIARSAAELHHRVGIPGS